MTYCNWQTVTTHHSTYLQTWTPLYSNHRQTTSRGDAYTMAFEPGIVEMDKPLLCSMLPRQVTRKAKPGLIRLSCFLADYSFVHQCANALLHGIHMV